MPSPLAALEPVIKRLLSSIRGISAASEVLMFFGDPADGEDILLLVETARTGGPVEPDIDLNLPAWSSLQNDFPGDGPVSVSLPETYSTLWSEAGFKKPSEAVWIPLKYEDRFLGGVLLSGGGVSRALVPAAAVEIVSVSEDLASLLSQVVRLESENEKLVQLIRMLQVTRTLMRESEAGHLLNLILNTLSRIVGNNRLALCPTTVLGEPKIFIRHIDNDEAIRLHELILGHLNPREDGSIRGRQSASDVSELFPEVEFTTFKKATPWILRDAGRTYLGILYLFDNDPAQEDTLGHAVIRTIVVELERTLRRYLLEDDAVHAVSELPYRIWSREYWLRRFEEEISLTGRRGTRVTCCILEILNYEQLKAEMDGLVLKESILTLIQIMKASVRETDLICRLDRNHFGILFLDAAKEKVLPALERIASRMQKIVGGASVAPSMSFAAGLAEFPWDGEGVPTLLRRAWTASAIARTKGPFTLELFDQDIAQPFLANNTDIREEITVNLELLGGLDLSLAPETLPPMIPEVR